MIRIIDYGLGNLQAFLNAYKQLGIPADRARTTEDLRDATKLILPGVGAFDHAMALLSASGMRSTLDEMVLEKQVPILGVCVGMQILAESSEEGTSTGLNWLPGKVLGFKSLNLDGMMLPHMGWNDVEPKVSNGLFANLPDARFYFLHSFYFQCSRAEDVAAVSNYGVEFSCAVRSGNVYGVQFHPEKSHHFGSQLLKNFGEL